MCGLGIGPPDDGLETNQWIGDVLCGAVEPIDPVLAETLECHSSGYAGT